MWKERTMPNYYVKACARLMVEGTAPVGRPKKTWQNQNVLYAEMHLSKVVHGRKK